MLIFVGKTSNKTFDVYNYIHSRTYNIPLIHVIGDSHSTVFYNKKQFIAHFLGAATMHNLNKKVSLTKSNEKLFKILRKLNTKRDIVMLSFGEIDCRIHMSYQYEKQQKKITIPKLIDQTIFNYGCVLKEIRQMGITLYVYGMPGAREIKYLDKSLFYGTDSMRSDIYGEFNDRLKKFCENNGYPYINIYPKVSDKNGFLLKEYVADEIHLNGKIADFVRQEINKNGRN
ncbi:MAG: hypothetical protein A2908_01665 [Candidatus Staskawiczbacteria bacterium RIFCSPLOWO2_01_FULL_38_12b]|uniref:SGNH hydrolase-type esterase domain-containing protein n=1 Tax=Candidatus Staskawiczbacteria bacterium RIFCSPLOWO2_01_FULL_38_12b TaxID=1802214 RepID=A0A1G2IDJ4_9BACT|nr:MAG: hypothetical protein A2908_01665 [Candidatus Staskawiczbacteria bacterium RIFCSPLOWO2_01_FULL_38_12b]